LEFSGYSGSFEKQKEFFERYITQIPDHGLCVLCLDSPEVEKIYQKIKSQKSNLVTYSLTKPADFNAENIECSASGIKFTAIFKGQKIENIQIPIYGKHNIGNALASIAVANFLGLNGEEIKKSLSKFNGVKRRFTKVGEYNQVAIIDDYGHHSTEIKTTLAAARSIVGKDHKIFCVFEPHKYTRVRDLFSEFCQAFMDADCVLVSEIYSAGQKPIDGINQDSLVEGIKKSGVKNVIKLSGAKPYEVEIAEILKDKIQPNDMIFCTGAGKVTYWASALETQFKNLNKL
jgi:UDP-N-acetylmuramate--alanine ligase